jgi:5-methyltetrahydrofolate--homocysteine methyltransferase
VTLIAKPNAGLPRMDGMVEAVYDVTPEIMAEYALKFGAQQVKMLGGCCGSDPSHITAIKAALQGFEPPALVEFMAEAPVAVLANGSDREERRRRRLRICEG